MARSKAQAKIDRKFAVSNTDKVLYPGGKFIKGRRGHIIVASRDSYCRIFAIGR
jgi:hypothetical protein